MSVHRHSGMTMVRAEWISNDAADGPLTDEQCKRLEQHMIYAASCLRRQWEQTARDEVAVDRMTRDGASYIGDGPYGA